MSHTPTNIRKENEGSLPPYASAQPGNPVIDSSAHQERLSKDTECILGKIAELGLSACMRKGTVTSEGLPVPSTDTTVQHTDPTHTYMTYTYPTHTYPTYAYLPHIYPTYTYPQHTQTHTYPQHTQTYTYPQHTQTYTYPQHTQTCTYPQHTQTHIYPTYAYPQHTQTHIYPTYGYPQHTQTYRYPHHPQTHTNLQHTQTHIYPTYTYPQHTQTHTNLQHAQTHIYPTYTYPQHTQTQDTKTTTQQTQQAVSSQANTTHPTSFTSQAHCPNTCVPLHGSLTEPHKPFQDTDSNTSSTDRPQYIEPESTVTEPKLIYSETDFPALSSETQQESTTTGKPEEDILPPLPPLPPLPRFQKGMPRRFQKDIPPRFQKNKRDRRAL